MSSDDDIPPEVKAIAARLAELERQPYEDPDTLKWIAIGALAVFIISFFFPNYSDDTHPKFMQGVAITISVIFGYLWLDKSGKRDARYNEIMRLSDRLRSRGYTFSLYNKDHPLGLEKIDPS
ncbi:hypothetical protein [Stappia indica]|uniref:hypothetical protein n=1 Tax=Stappia indica TaxID=538381 RepID=UPI001D17F0A8|nr:hypothetical protein [Stappia indica]MCC4243385.1 hypothetical protein [Stappia indica]